MSQLKQSVTIAIMNRIVDAANQLVLTFRRVGFRPRGASAPLRCPLSECRTSLPNKLTRVALLFAILCCARALIPTGAYSFYHSPSPLQTPEPPRDSRRTREIAIKIGGTVHHLRLSTGALDLLAIALLAILFVGAVLLAFLARRKARFAEKTNRKLQVEIMERKRSEEELRKATEMMRAVAETAPLAISAIDLKGRVTFWNPAAEHLFGWSAAEVMGQRLPVIPPAERHQFEHRLALYEQKRAMKGVEVNYVRKDGTLIDANLWTAPLTDPQGNAIGGLGIVVDFTERKQAIEQLRISELHFRQLADSMPQIVWTAGPDGTIEYLNRQWYEFSGFSSSDGLAENVHSLIHSDDLENFVNGWQAAVSANESYTAECRFADRATGGYRWFLCRATPAPEASSSKIRWFGTFTDIDNQKRMESAFRRANDDLNRFAYSTSHDLQEPLRRVLAYSQLLEKRHGGSLDAEAESFVQFISKDARRMCSLIANLAVYTGAGTSTEQTPAYSDANLCLDRALFNLGEVISESQAHISYRDLPTVRIPEGDLQEVLQNLVQNAIQYRKAGVAPRVNITAHRRGNEWIISVEDNGIGIDPRYTDQIFGVFKRLHGPGQYGSTGMGLAICRKIIEHQGGRIWVESQPGIGSIFRFSMPAVIGTDAAAGQHEAARASAPQGTNR